MASGFAATPEELDQLVTDIRNVNDNVQGTLNSVRGTVDTVSGSWKGQAQQAFSTLMERYNTDAQKLQEALLTIADGISGTSTTMKQTEEEQGGSMNSIMNRLG
ncbi:WXG100 family type VII secretion target [Lentzea tibetensis]|uniref:ESAT-6-like protein n=1 Tax=Lentzea tibetensis TaxID=2591470 RepID=A0A563EIR1_9PSEU|nr:WXG100 family type VII secretion target [Lentzea tibetensis]TWP46402.1 WXG100 family type VII secretion target [Lentzea tibetensis]